VVDLLVVSHPPWAWGTRF